MDRLIWYHTVIFSEGYKVNLVGLKLVLMNSSNAMMNFYMDHIELNMDQEKFLNLLFNKLFISILDQNISHVYVILRFLSLNLLIVLINKVIKGQRSNHNHFSASRMYAWGQGQLFLVGCRFGVSARGVGSQSAVSIPIG